MQAITSAVIAAAGLGSRLGFGVPKCMIEVGGKTILSRLIETLQNHVSVIHVVVGYREEMVVEHCARYHREVVLVRNPDYRRTNTAHSLAIGARYLDGQVIYLDGDLVISPVSLAGFLCQAKQLPILVGLTDAKSDNPVYVHGAERMGLIHLDRFSRAEQSRFEWANVVVGPADLLEGASAYVYQRLEEHMPLAAAMLELAEVDTVADLELAKKFVERMT